MGIKKIIKGQEGELLIFEDKEVTVILDGRAVSIHRDSDMEPMETPTLWERIKR